MVPSESTIYLTQASYRSAKTAKTKETRLMINKINYSSEHAHTSLVITLAQVYKGERLLLFNLSFSKRQFQRYRGYKILNHYGLFGILTFGGSDVICNKVREIALPLIATSKIIFAVYKLILMVEVASFRSWRHFLKPQVVCWSMHEQNKQKKEQ